MRVSRTLVLGLHISSWILKRLFCCGHLEVNSEAVNKTVILKYFPSSSLPFWNFLLELKSAAQSLARLFLTEMPCSGQTVKQTTGQKFDRWHLPPWRKKSSILYGCMCALLINNEYICFSDIASMDQLIKIPEVYHHSFLIQVCICSYSDDNNIDRETDSEDQFFLNIHGGEWSVIIIAVTAV